MALIVPMSMLGLFMGKILHNATQDFALIVLVSLLLFLSLISTLGAHNFLKYYYIKKFKRMRHGRTMI